MPDQTTARTSQSSRASSQDNQKKQPGTYDHDEIHTKVYSYLGVSAVDNEIDRAWARLYDKGINAGPALKAAEQWDDGYVRQFFQYAYAVLDLNEDNTNKTVVFRFGPLKSEEYTESGL
jgi:hypothetical protein